MRPRSRISADTNVCADSRSTFKGDWAFTVLMHSKDPEIPGIYIELAMHLHWQGIHTIPKQHMSLLESTIVSNSEVTSQVSDGML